MKKFTIFFVLVTLTMFVHAQEEKNAFRWPGDKKAAVCLSYDDALDCHLDYAVPALDRYGLKGTFFCTGFSPALQMRLDEWRKISENGHELGNHTLFHPCSAEGRDWVKSEYDLDKYNLSQIRNEIFTANTILKAIDGKSERCFAYTCSDYRVGDGYAFSRDIKDMVLAARSDGPIPVNMSEVDPFLVPSWCVDEPSGEDLINYVKTALEMGTMAVFMFHSVGGGYLNVSNEAHEELLKFLFENREIIWTDSFINIMTYVKALQ